MKMKAIAATPWQKTVCVFGRVDRESLLALTIMENGWISPFSMFNTYIHTNLQAEYASKAMILSRILALELVVLTRVELSKIKYSGLLSSRNAVNSAPMPTRETASVASSRNVDITVKHHFSGRVRNRLKSFSTVCLFKHTNNHYNKFRRVETNRQILYYRHCYHRDQYCITMSDR